MEHASKGVNMEELKPNGIRRPRTIIVNCPKCYKNPCECKAEQRSK